MVCVECSMCKEVVNISITDEELIELEMMPVTGKHIQDVLPNVPRDKRELFISGICPKCWKKMFG